MISKKLREQVYNKYKDMQIDHIVSKYWYGGEDKLENYNPSCRQCNFYKGTKTLEAFRNELEKEMLPRLEKLFIYRLAKKYGLVEETP